MRTEPCRILEIISPAGFEHLFREWDAGTKDGTLDPDALSARYGIEGRWGPAPGAGPRTRRQDQVRPIS